MDITQLLSLGGYTTIVCFFFYKLNEKTIREWREEHTKQMKESQDNWREMFKYMNDRIDRK